MDPLLTHGWPGLALGYGAVQAPLLAGLIHGRAHLRQILLSPIVAAPLTAAAGATMTVIGGGSLLQLALGAGLSAGLGYAAGLRIARAAAPASVHRRGALVIEAPRRPARPPRAVCRDADAALTFAGIPLAMQDETRHFKLIGTTGTGKSTAIHALLKGALARGDRAVIADPDGGYLARFHDARRGDVILNPFDARSVKWDLFGELRDPYDVEQLARSLIPDHEGADRSWRGYARTFFSAVTRQAAAAGITDVAELYRLLVVAGTPELRTLVAGTPAQPFLEEHNGRMFDSIRSVTSSAVAALEHVAQQRSAPFSVRKWVERREAGVLFIPYRAGQIAALRSSISAWMRLAIFEAMNQAEGDQRLWFVVDELDALGQIDGLKDALARLRKFGGRCVLGFQSIAQVSGTYGAGEAQTIVENGGNSLILRCSASEHGGTAHFASRLIGQREVIRTALSTSRRPTEWLASATRSEHHSIESAVMDAELEQLPDLQGFVKLASRPAWMRVTLAVSSAAAAPESQAAQRLRFGALESWRRLRRARRDFQAHEERELHGRRNPADRAFDGGGARPAEGGRGHRQEAEGPHP